MRLILALLSLFVTTITAEAATWFLEADGSGDAPHIQAAIDSAAPGDTILLNDGVFTGMGNRFLIVPNSLSGLTVRSVNGRDFTTVDLALNRGFTLNASSIAIEGLTLARGSNLIGGAIEINKPGSVIRDCRFVNCTGHGGAIGFFEAGGEVYSCEFYECYGGSGQTVIQSFDASTILAEDCIFARNTVGAASLFEGIMTFRNTTFHDNSSSVAGVASHLTHYGGTLEVENCLLAGGTGKDPVISTGGTLNISCTNIYRNSPGDWIDDIAGLDTVNGNFSLDPKFCDAANGDFSLRSGSPCIDAPGCGLVGSGGEGCAVISTGVADGRPVAGENATDGDAADQAHAFASLFQVAPNPFGEETTVFLARPLASGGTLTVYDLAGRAVREMSLSASIGSIDWDGRDAAGRRLHAGVYFLRVETMNASETRRIVLMH